MRVNLILKREFYDQILSGDKVEEYRDKTKYYIRLFYEVDRKTGLFGFKDIDEIKFFEGYAKGRRSMVVECKEIELDQDEEGEFFVLHLGKVKSATEKVLVGLKM